MRRRDPARIDDARRIAARNRLCGHGLSADRAEAWIEAWKLHADRLGIVRDGAYWEAASAWIDEQRRLRHVPAASDLGRRDGSGEA
jgi:hypothetical protein